MNFRPNTPRCQILTVSCQHTGFHTELVRRLTSISPAGAKWEQYNPGHFHLVFSGGRVKATPEEAGAFVSQYIIKGFQHSLMFQ